MTKSFDRILADRMFTAEMFAAAVKSLRGAKKVVTLSDPMTTGLQAIIRPSGAISFHVHYHYNGHRPLLKLGDFPGMTITQARELTRTVIALGELGIDPQEDFRERLIRELLRDGEKWRP